MKTSRYWFVWAAVIAMVTLALVALGIRSDMSPAWIAALGCGAPLACIVAYRWPPVLLTGLLFIGSFKSGFADGFSLSDPTAMILVLLSATLLCQFLLRFSGAKGHSFFELFAGQGAGIVWFFAFVGAVGISYLHSPASNVGLTKFTKFACIETLLFIAPLVVFENADRVRQFLVATVGASLALGVKVLWMLQHPTPVLNGKELDVTQIMDAQLIGISVLVLLYFKIAPPRWRPAILVAVAFMSFTVVASMARGPMFSLMVVLIVSLLFLRHAATLLSRRTIAMCLLSMFAIAFLGLNYLSSKNPAREKIATKTLELHSRDALVDPSGTTGMRLDFYEAAVRGFLQRPLGSGVGSWGVYYYGQETIDYPHNMVLEIAFEEGIFGLVLFGLFLRHIVRKVRYTLRHENGPFVFLGPVMAFSFFVTMFSGDINSNRLFWFWAGATLAIARLTKAAETQRELARAAYASASPVAMPPEKRVRRYPEPSTIFNS